MFNWSPAVKAVVRRGHFSFYEFIHVQVDTQLLKTDGSNNADTGLFLTNYHGNFEVAGNEYVADIIKGISYPSVTGTGTQEVQRLSLNQSLTTFTQEDVITLLGPNYHQARIVVNSYVEDAGAPLIDPFYRAAGIVKGITRDAQDASVQMEVSNIFGQLARINGLRTTTGSIKRFSGTDTTFDKAAAVDDSVLLAWGTEV